MNAKKYVGLPALFIGSQLEKFPESSDDRLEDALENTLELGRRIIKLDETRDKLDKTQVKLKKRNKRVSTLHKEKTEVSRELSALKRKTEDRNKRGAIAKNEKLKPVKAIAKSTYEYLHKKLGHPPRLREFIKELKKRKPAEGSDQFVNNWWERFSSWAGCESTVKRWLQKMKKGESF